MADVDPDKLSRALCVRLTVPERLAETVHVAVSVLIRVAVLVPVRVGVVVRDRTEDGVPLRDPEYEDDTLELREVLAEKLPDTEPVTDGVPERLRLLEPDYEDECVPVRLTVPLRVPPLEGVPVPVTVPLREASNDKVAQADREGVRVRAELGVPDPERLLVGDELKLLAAEGPVVELREPREVPVEDSELRDVEVGRTEADELRVEVSERDALLVGDDDRDESSDRVPLEVPVGLLLCVVDLE